jgi:hypothetical protein
VFSIIRFLFAKLNPGHDESSARIWRFTLLGPGSRYQ